MSGSLGVPRTKLVVLKNPGLQWADLMPYLEARRYDVIEVHKLKDAVQYITENKPEYAFLSTDLIPPRSQWMYGIINQLSHIVLYADKINAKALAVTRELPNAYFVEPPLTPIVFEQTIQRFERDFKRPMVGGEYRPELEKIPVWIMSALSDLALKALCRPGPRANEEKTDRVNRITSFRVETKRISGYFILAYGRGRPLDTSFTESLQERLRSFLTSFGEKSVLGPGEQLEIKEVMFDKWTRDRAEFIRQALHTEAEMTLAFFREPTPMEIRPSGRRSHVELALDHIRGDQPVDFDIYIYLPQNARYVLYTPQGGTLYETQKQKLLQEGVGKVHIHKRALDDLQRYQTRHFIRENLSSYRPPESTS